MARRNFFQRTQKKHAQSRIHENPYFRHERKVPWKILVVIVGTFTILIVLVGFLFAHPTLAIHSVDVDGLEYIEKGAFENEVRGYLNQNAFFFFSRSNQFLFSQQELETALYKKFTFTSLTISQTGKDLHIQVVERTSNLVWMTDKEYIVDLEGIVVRPLNREIPEDTMLASRLPLFYDVNEVPVETGSPVLMSEEIENVFRFHEILVSQDITFTSTHVNRLTGGWMSVVTDRGYEIYFDVTGDVETQGKNLQRVLDEQQENLDDLEYIDLRFGDRVYLK